MDGNAIEIRNQSEYLGEILCFPGIAFKVR